MCVCVRDGRKEIMYSRFFFCCARMYDVCVFGKVLEKPVTKPSGMSACVCVREKHVCVYVRYACVWERIRETSEISFVCTYMYACDICIRVCVT